MATAAPGAQLRTLRIFISYASEDLNLAVAIAKGLRSALGEYFAEINFDRWSLHAGEDFKKQLAIKLAASDILIIIYTGTDKLSFSYTGWELGFFEGLMKTSPQGRQVIPMFLKFPPEAASAYQGVGLNIQDDFLRLSVEDFSGQNVVHQDDPMCRLIQELQDTVDKYTDDAGLPRNHNRPTPVEAFSDMRLDIFRYLKTTVAAIMKPQKQITIRTIKAAINTVNADLPPDAKLIPVGDGNPMSIFDLPDIETTWETFLRSASSRHRDAWRTAIANVATSSLQGLNVDNSQVILSHDESKSYRLIMTTATRYYNDTQEFNVYFVERWRGDEYGDQDTTLLLKGLHIVCRYRFLFLEVGSKFSSNNISFARPDQLKALAGELLRELDLMKLDSLNAGLDQAAVWTRFVDWDTIRQVAAVYEPAEKAIRQLIGNILVSVAESELLDLGRRLAEVVETLTSATKPQNNLLIKAMSQQLQALVTAAPSTGN